MVKIKNNAFGTLAGSILSGATTIALTAGHGARFPAAATGGDYFNATLIDASGNSEIIQVTNRATDSLTVIRGVDGTAGRAFSGGDRIELRPCNATSEYLRQESGQLDVATGTDTYAVTLAYAPPAYNANQVYRAKFTNANTLADPTVNFNGLGAVTMKYVDGSTIAAGGIPAGFCALLVYDGAHMLLLNPFVIPSSIPAGVVAGTIIDFGGTAAPTGYLLCDGTAVSRATYATLFAAIGSTWGAGNGTTTFNVPDLRRRVGVGSGGVGTGTLGNAAGNTGGEETHALSIAELASHNHGGATGGGTTGGQSADHSHNFTTYYDGVTALSSFTTATDSAINTSTATTSGASADHTHSVPALAISSQGSGTAHNNVQPSAIVTKCIKV